MIPHSTILKTNVMEQFKKAKVVMLPTNEKTNIINTNQGLLYNYNDYIGINQHLYIISDDEIKEGDWYYSIQGNRIQQSNKQDIDIFTRTPEILIAFKKIIATTDDSLYYKDTSKNPRQYMGSYISMSLGENLPQPSKQFIQKFIKEYNEGNTIEWVDVEYICVGYDTSVEGNPNIFIPKVNSKNEIFIRKIKDSWNREEVIDLCRKAFLLYKSDNSGYPGLIKSTQEKENKWIEENL